MKAVKIRIYPDAAQQEALAKSFGCARWVWNYSLSLMTETYRETGKGLSAYTVKKLLPQLKQEHEWLKEPYSQCLQSAVLNLSQAFVNFFEGRSKYPRFKTKHGRQSIQYPQNVKLEGGWLVLPKMGNVAAKVHRPIEGKIKTVTITMNPDGRHFAALCLDDGSEKPLASADGKAVGIDLGLTHVVITSDGSKFDNPRHIAKHQRNLKRKQRKLSGKQKGSNRRRKARTLVARVHQKIANSRNDFLHKLSRKMVDENQVIIVENLTVRNMVKNHCLAKSISDAGWGRFCTMLKYKAEQDGKVYQEVDRFFPSSHLCHVTLLPIEKMGLSIRSFECPHCGQRHDRDVNAAINIRNEGLRLLALGTSAAAQGGSVRPKGGRRKSTLSEAAANELGSPHSTQSVSVG
ncbi:MAG: IS200/IS605 family element transposase accessory protein TnpB [Synechococcales cyanobacterium K44_A2020_017]|nr:IS200/IS605 family element transposase accessory protein TnpB [Synechococcales cyanobacterium K32_A2020_035]MBF2096562.1 IS200/IS605 family element transposase accessory protein TnpB [Synechococcales cyanobacterium K44_A2020_017]